MALTLFYVFACHANARDLRSSIITNFNSEYFNNDDAPERIALRKYKESLKSIARLSLILHSVR